LAIAARARWSVCCAISTASRSIRATLLEKAWSSWKDLDTGNPQLPPLPSRIALVKLFIELALLHPALDVLQGILATDDEEVEAWYLEGWRAFSSRSRRTMRSLRTGRSTHATPAMRSSRA